MKLRPYWIFFVLSALAIGGFVGALGYNEINNARNHAPQIPYEKPLPNFSLTAHNGKTVDKISMIGKVWVADFIFTTCPGPCQQMSRKMKEIQDALAGTKDVELVSFTVNPEQDTPEVLAKYGQKYGAADNWLFLTGPKKAIYDLGVQGFQLPVVDTGDAGKLEDQFIHSTKLAVVDREGNVRAYFDGQAPDVAQQVAASVRHWLLN